MKVTKFSTVCLIIGLLYPHTVWSKATEFSELAEGFFTAASSGEVADIEEFVSPQWASAMSPDQFKRFLNVLSLDDYQGAEWGNSEAEDGLVTLKGKFVSSDDKFPISLMFYQHDGKWLIDSISVSPSTPQATLPEPGYEAVVALVQGTMKDFANAVNKRDMTSFYASASSSMRIQHAVSEFQEAYSQFFGDDDFSLRVAGVPGVAKPTYKEGYLEIHGGYKTGGYTTRVKIEYVNDWSEWKLASLAIRSNLTEE